MPGRSPAAAISLLIFPLDQSLLFALAGPGEGAERPADSPVLSQPVTKNTRVPSPALLLTRPRAMKIDFGQDFLQRPRQPPDAIAEQQHQRRQQDDAHAGSVEQHRDGQAGAELADRG